MEHVSPSTPYRPLATLVVALAVSLGSALAQPYAGTIFIDPDIITDSDPSTLVSVSYSGQGNVTVYDRRPAAFITINAYLFDVLWDDGLTCTAMVNPEFGSVLAATAEAQLYAQAVGQLPTCLRTDVDALWIHAGVFSFGGGNNAILIHTGRGAEYIASGILAEALVHEGTHTSLDAANASAPGWVAAQQADPEFISTYAQDNPTTEDLAESYLCWLAVRHRADRISQQNVDLITQAIPNRLAYFDNLPCDLYPITSAASIAETGGPTFGLSVYPNPASGWLSIGSEQPLPANARLELIASDGRMVRSTAINSGGRIALDALVPGLYLWRCTTAGAVLGNGRVAVE